MPTTTIPCDNLSLELHKLWVKMHPKEDTDTLIQTTLNMGTQKSYQVHDTAISIVSDASNVSETTWLRDRSFHAT